MAGLTRLAPDASPHAAHSVYTLDAARAGEAQPLAAQAGIVGVTLRGGPHA
jgi:hypothetical protein